MVRHRVEWIGSGMDGLMQGFDLRQGGLWAGGMGPKRVGPWERRGKSAERSEKRETSTIKMRGSKDTMVRSQKGGMVEKRVGP